MQSSLSVNSKCIIAAAGSGKTTYIVDNALESCPKSKILITTFTRENEKEIRKKILKKTKAIPSNITVQTWWSFLFQHGIRPYQNLITDTLIKGLEKVDQRSGFKCNFQGHPVFFGQEAGDNFYLSSCNRLYSDKIAIFTVTANNKSNGALFDRISKIFNEIYIDEIQDLAGYDLEIVHEIIKKIPTILVGDPRQATYETHFSQKNKEFSGGKIDQYLTKKCKKICEIDKSTLQHSYRSHEAICKYSSTLFPDFPQIESLSSQKTNHDGVFFVSRADTPQYLAEFSPVQLRHSIKTPIDNNYRAYNYGESKGLTFDRVLIYPTEPIKKHILGKKLLTGTSLCKYYVALTRAKHSVAILWDNPPTVDGILEFSYHR